MTEQQYRKRAKEAEILQLLIIDRKKKFDLAFKLISDEYTSFLMAITLKKGNNKEDAEDIVLKVMDDAQKALRDEQAYPAERLQTFELTSWLITLTLHECFHRYVGTRKRPSHEPLPPDESIGSGSISRLFAHSGQIPEEVLESKELMQAILNAFERLPLRYKKVMQLFVLEGWSQKEISIDLKLSYSNVRTRCARGFKLLQILVLEELRECGEENLAISLEMLIDTDEQEEE